MGKRAVVRGEFHVSTIDRKALLNRDLSGFQALYREGRSDVIRIPNYSIRYLLYVIGILTLQLIYTLTSHIFNWVLPFWAFDLEEEARSHGLDFDKEIDLEVDENYDSYDNRIGNTLLFLLLVLFLLTILEATRRETLDFGVVSTTIPYWVAPLVLGISLPFLYSAALISLGGAGERDEKMAASIDEKALENGHDGVLVIVGDSHVDDLGDNLEELGWTVDKERSSHPVPRLSRALKRGWNAVTSVNWWIRGIIGGN